MEKLQPFIEMFKKYHFWMLCLVCIVLTIYSWNIASQEVEKDFAQKKLLVAKKFDKVAQLSNRKDYVNKDWAAETHGTANQVSAQIKNAKGQILSAHQAAQQWDPLFGEDFIKIASTTDPKNWDDATLAKYAQVVPLVVQKWKQRIGISEQPNQGGVIWKKKNFDQLLSAFTAAARSRDNVATTQRVLWVYDALIGIVVRTNEGAPNVLNLPIHTINQLGVRGSTATIDPKDWYVKGSNPGTDDNSKVKAVPGYDSFPVKMSIRMDLRYLSKLLVQCANSDLPLDIRGIRFVDPDRLVDVNTLPQTIHHLISTRQSDSTYPGRQDPEFGAGPMTLRLLPILISQGFGGRGRKKVEDKAKNNAKDKDKAVKATQKLERGTMVEIFGTVYVAKEPPKANPKPADKAAARHGESSSALVQNSN